MVKADAFGSFLVASTVGLFVVVYTFRIPHMITQNPSIVDEYYVGNFCWAFPVDIALIGAYLALLFRATARVLFEREPVESEGEPEALDLGILRLDQAIHQADFELARARAEAETEANR